MTNIGWNQIESNQIRTAWMVEENRKGIGCDKLDRTWSDGMGHDRSSQHVNNTNIII